MADADPAEAREARPDEVPRVDMLIRPNDQVGQRAGYIADRRTGDQDPAEALPAVRVQCRQVGAGWRRGFRVIQSVIHALTCDIQGAADYYPGWVVDAVALTATKNMPLLGVVPDIQTVITSGRDVQGHGRA